MQTRNVLYLVVGALLVIVAILAYRVYRDRQEPGIDINIGKNGISIEKR
jgi:predicted negative regulator of RcsB-dependent stress response